MLLTAHQIFNATRFLSFIENLPPEPIRLKRIGIPCALPTDFMEVPFEKYLYCDNLYQGFLQTKSNDILKEMAQILYDSSLVRPTKAQLVGVFYWFAALKTFFSRKFHHFLQPTFEVKYSSSLIAPGDFWSRTFENLSLRCLAVSP